MRWSANSNAPPRPLAKGLAPGVVPPGAPAGAGYALLLKQYPRPPRPEGGSSDPVDYLLASELHIYQPNRATKHAENPKNSN